MSIQAMASCWGTDFPCEADGVAASTVRLVGLAIADVVNDLHHNEFFGSTVNIARKCGVHRNTVTFSLQHFARVGVLKVVRDRPGHPTVAGSPS